MSRLNRRMGQFIWAFNPIGDPEQDPNILCEYDILPAPANGTSSVESVYASSTVSLPDKEVYQGPMDAIQSTLRGEAGLGLASLMGSGSEGEKVWIANHQWVDDKGKESLYIGYLSADAKAVQISRLEGSTLRSVNTLQEVGARRVLQLLHLGACVRFARSETALDGFAYNALEESVEEIKALAGQSGKPEDDTEGKIRDTYALYTQHLWCLAASQNASPNHEMSGNIKGIDLDAILGQEAVLLDEIYLGNFDAFKKTQGKLVERTAPVKNIHGLRERYRGLMTDNWPTEIAEKQIASDGALLEDSHYLPSKHIEQLLSSITKSSYFRNILLQGPPGTGKSFEATALANALGVMKTVVTLSASSMEDDLIGKFVPNTKGTDGYLITETQELLEQIDALNQKIDASHVPSRTAVEFTPDVALSRFGGEKPVGDITPEYVYGEIGKAYADIAKDVEESLRHVSSLKAMYRRLMERNESSFSFEETEFVKAFRMGGVTEIQEANRPLEPGVLTVLNEALTTGFLYVNGETIKRHPGHVMVFTINPDVQSARKMDESVTNRMHLTYEYGLQGPEIMFERAKEKYAHILKPDALLEMARVIDSMQEEVKRDKHRAKSTISYRNLVNWIELASINGDVYATCEPAVINAVAYDEESRMRYIACLDSGLLATVKTQCWLADS